MTPARRGTRGPVPCCAIVALVPLLAGGVGPSPAAAQTPGHGPGIEAVAFLAGCWAGTTGSLDMREQWSEAEGGVMLGTTRFYRDGALVDFEFGMISTVEGALTLWPYPRGNRSEHGFPLVRTEPELVFENLEHDFPVRIIYGNGPGWRLERVTCPG